MWASRTALIRQAARAFKGAWPLLALAWSPAAVAGLLGDAALDDAAQAARTTPGAEAPMDTPSNGSYMTVYVPSDYDAEATWPLILCYHGARGRPTTWPFRQATGGEGFIVAGLEYGTPGYASGLGADRLAPEIAHVEAVLEQLQTAFSIDPDHIFMGGFSQGGYSTTVLGERLGERLAGLAILGAGRVYVDRRKPAKAAIWRKPVFIGCGAEDTVHHPRALEAATMYRRWGANVTFEEWSGVGHTFDASKSSALGEWLRNVAADETTESSRFGGVRVRVQ